MVERCGSLTPVKWDLVTVDHALARRCRLSVFARDLPIIGLGSNGLLDVLASRVVPQGATPTIRRWPHGSRTVWPQCPGYVNPVTDGFGRGGGLPPESGFTISTTYRPG